jgi:hypothetical protein
VEKAWTGSAITERPVQQLPVLRRSGNIASDRYTIFTVLAGAALATTACTIEAPLALLTD